MLRDPEPKVRGDVVYATDVEHLGRVGWVLDVVGVEVVVLWRDDDSIRRVLRGAVSRHRLYRLVADGHAPSVEEIEVLRRVSPRVVFDRRRFRQWNAAIARGDGRCSACAGSGERCTRCLWGLCVACAGTGCGSSREHCPSCASNVVRWGGRDLRDLVDL